MTKFLKDPLAHFLIAGLALFVLFQFVGQRSPLDGDTRTITVDRDALLTFIQYRTKRFEPDIAAKRLDGMSEQDLRRLINDYVREEALHREALALGLDESDYVIRRRLVQKLEFFAEGFADDLPTLEEEALGAYYDDNRADYYVAPSITFAHVFFSAEKRGWDAARAAASAALKSLNKEGAAFSEATRHGDPFLYHVNYVDRTLDYVASHFGEAMAKEAFALNPDGTRWQGPFDSKYGTHVLMITRSISGRFPMLEEIRGRVRQDARRAFLRERRDVAIQKVVDSYDVQVLISKSDGPGGADQ